MGFSDLSLVGPRKFPSGEATAMASGADDLLAAAQVVDSLREAIDGCSLVIGTTARDRHLSWPVISPAKAAGLVREALQQGPAAIVFGRENSGLSNAELDLCQHAIRIPSNPEFSSLNLSQAVQICAYEVHQALLGERGSEQETVTMDAGDRLATVTEMDRLHAHFIQVMTDVGYFDPQNPRLLERRLRRLLNRGELQLKESQILRGFLSAVEYTIGTKSSR